MTIGEVSKKVDLTKDTLRYYEKIGLLNPISKKESGIRSYGEKDIKRIQFVKCMRKAGLSIESLKEYLILFEEGEKTSARRREILCKEKALLEEKIKNMKEAHHMLTYKIDLYDKGAL